MEIDTPQMCHSFITLGQNAFEHTPTFPFLPPAVEKRLLGVIWSLCSQRASSEGALEIVPERDVQTVATDPSTRAAVCVAGLMHGSRCLFLHLVDSICFLLWKSQSSLLEVLWVVQT